ncbi:MAG TPA: PDC sensor domain-containing protein [Thermoanaerobaculia bacterium]|nr:PDC sensor domain-containing protein [Thermoanaerobaculia bacterium]
MTLLIATWLVIAGFFGQSAESMQRDLAGHAEQVRALASDKILIDAIKSQNAKKTPLAEIQRLDKLWIDDKDEQLVHTVTTGRCAEHLRQIATASGFGEMMVMDDQGALVCSNARTSDYWQGDEEKWTRAFNNGKGATFIDRPRLDESSKTNLAQISVPVTDGGRAIGVITAGIPLHQLEHK